MILAYLFNSNQLKESVSEDVVYTLTCNPIFYFLFFCAKKTLNSIKYNTEAFFSAGLQVFIYSLKKIYLSSVAELREDW